jgi:hypothetical protein
MRASNSATPSGPIQTTSASRIAVPLILAAASIIRIAVRPICTVHGVEAHPSVANMDPRAVVLEFVRPARPGGRLFGDDWLTWTNESGR